MLESCQKEHMFLGLGLLVAVTIVVLIIESRYADVDSLRRNKTQNYVIENNSTCWRHENYTVVQECHPCSAFDIVSKSIGVCIHTHYKEVLRCSSGEMVTKSCDSVAYIEQRNFIKFEVACLAVATLSYLLSYARDRLLARRTHQKIERQLNRVR